MKRSNNTYTLNKFIISLFISILLVLPSNIIASNYVFEEDFSSGSGDWTFVGANWRNWGTTGIEVVDHSLSIQDGRLVSNRFINDSGWIWDHAYHATTLENGVWEFKVQQDRYTTLPNDSSNPYDDYHWQFELTDQDLDWDGKNTSTLIAFWILVQFRSFNGANTIIIEEGNAITIQKGTSAQVYTRTDDFVENGVDYTFKIVKNEGTIIVFINNVEIIEHELVGTRGSFNHFGVATTRPISFDDFKVTEDHSVREENGDSGFMTTTNIVTTIGTVALAGLSYKFYFSKKTI
ncbi:MAG: hypothetical protein IH840_04435 [Candidatus Heimdallarchaeota archaeon]|nr:hypothetical protein [Candidatus Heimdallarchaeota archaeon]